MDKNNLLPNIFLISKRISWYLALSFSFYLCETFSSRKQLVKLARCLTTSDSEIEELKTITKHIASNLIDKKLKIASFCMFFSYKAPGYFFVASVVTPVATVLMLAYYSALHITKLMR